MLRAAKNNDEVIAETLKKQLNEALKATDKSCKQ